MNYESVKIRMYVRFQLRAARPNKLGKRTLDCRVRVGGIPANAFSTSLSIYPSTWDCKRQIINGDSDEIIKQNKKLVKIKMALEEIFELNLAQGKTVTAKGVVSQFQGKSKVFLRFSELSKEFREDLRVRGRRKPTLDKYRRCYEYLAEYLGTDMPIWAIERSHVAGFWTWLKKKGFKRDYCNKLIQACHGAFLYAMREGHISSSPFANIRLEWENDFDITCLDHDEIDLIKNKQWSEKLQRVADSFLFMCYTGLHISDYQNVIEADRYVFQGMEFMRVKRFKTKVEAMFPLDPEAIRIIEKYNGINNLPKISNQKSNDYLKLIAAAVGIEKNLTNKVARKTFTDRCLNDYGLSDEVVAVMLGHTSTKQLKHYGTIKERRILREWKGKATAGANIYK